MTSTPRVTRFDENGLYCGDCIEIPLADKSVDLVFCSPPYEDAREYGGNVGKRDGGETYSGEMWVEWAKYRFIECMRVCRGLVCWVVNGRTKDFRWSATPALLMVALHKEGIKLRNPGVYGRVGIPGSGGPDYLRVDHEYIICASHGKLPWSNNCVMGSPPKYAPGGPPSHRISGSDERVSKRTYKPPLMANPGSVLWDNGTPCGTVVHGSVGKGHMGSDLAHENEAPFPEWLAEFYIRSFCKYSISGLAPDNAGIVLDPFCGSGTTLAVAKRCGRRWYGMDIRESQIMLSQHRLEEVEV